jgi:pyruvate/2-oxoglutarate dehydrogenase complex dihydrolipoamide dehydrogenase (E3) component
MLGNGVSEELQNVGVRIHDRVAIEGLERAEDGALTVLASGKKYTGFDCVIWAIGRYGHPKQIE